MNGWILLATTALMIAGVISTCVWTLRRPVCRYCDSWRHRLSHDLTLAGLGPSVAHWWMITSLVVATILAIAIVITPLWWLAPASIPGVALGSATLLRRLRARRRAKIELQLSGTLRAIAANFEAEASIPIAIAASIARAPEPIRSELDRLMSSYHLGASLPDAIRGTKARLGLADFDLVASALLVARDMGGDAARVLRRIADSLDTIQLMRSKVRTATAGGRTNVAVLSAMPPLFLLLDYFIDPEAVKLLFTQTLGWMVLLIAGGLSTFAVRWARTIVTIDV